MKIGRILRQRQIDGMEIIIILMTKTDNDASYCLMFCLIQRVERKFKIS